MVAIPPPVFARTMSATDVSLAMTSGQVLQDVDHLFDPKLTHDDVSGLGLLARVARALLDGSLDSHKLSAAMIRRKWDVALHTAGAGVRAAGGAPEHILAATLALLHVPVCYVDLFALGATKTLDLSNYNKIKSALVPTSVQSYIESAPVAFAARNLTRDGLLRLAAHGSILWARSPGVLDFDLDHPPEAARLERHQKVLEHVAKNPDVYTDVMTHVMKEDWVEANRAATGHLSSLGIKGGATLHDPPCLADFLLIALTPWGDPVDIARQIHDHFK